MDPTWSCLDTSVFSVAEWMLIRNYVLVSVLIIHSPWHVGRIMSLCPPLMWIRKICTSTLPSRKEKISIIFYFYDTYDKTQLDNHQFPRIANTHNLRIFARKKQKLNFCIASRSAAGEPVLLRSAAGEPVLLRMPSDVLPFP